MPGSVPGLYAPLSEPSQPSRGTEPIITTLLRDGCWSQGGQNCVTSRLAQPIYLALQIEKLRPRGREETKTHQAKGLVGPLLP